MDPAIAQHRSGISAICQRYRIHRLEVFGSAARADDFDPESSDADFLVEFAPDVQPYVLASINRNREAIYAAA
jgi:predicted nucleotidyltransferase